MRYADGSRCSSVLHAAPTTTSPSVSAPKITRMHVWLSRNHVAIRVALGVDVFWYFKTWFVREVGSLDSLSKSISPAKNSRICGLLPSHKAHYATIEHLFLDFPLLNAMTGLDKIIQQT